MTARESINWPEGASTAFKRKSLAQGVPPATMAELLLAHYRSDADDPEQPFGPFMTGIACLIDDPCILLRRLDAYTDPEGRHCYVQVADYEQVLWLDESQVLALADVDEWRTAVSSSTGQGAEDATEARAAQVFLPTTDTQSEAIDAVRPHPEAHPTEPQEQPWQYQTYQDRWVVPWQNAKMNR